MAMKQDIISDLSALPYAREVQDYLMNLSIARTGKKRPPTDYIYNLERKSGTFVTARDLHNVLSDICNIYKTRGYRVPWALENDLIHQYQPELSNEAIQAASLYAAEELNPDRLTGYFQKTQVPLTVGLSALYVQTTGQPVSILEIDYSNMRGTNEHFANLLATAQEKDKKNVMTEAMSLTDQAAFIIAQTITSTLRELLQGRDDVTLIPLRTGGDEARIVIPNLKKDDADVFLKTIHDRVENVTALMGLHDHAHSKRTFDRTSNGFGASGAFLSLTPSGHYDFSETIKKVDQVITETKIKIGCARINSPEFNNIKLIGSTDPKKYTDRDTASDLIEFSILAMVSMHENIASLDQYPHRSPRLEEIIHAEHSDSFITRQKIQIHFAKLLKADIDSLGITLTPQQYNLLKIKIMKFPAEDFATDTLLSRDMPAMAGAAMAVVDSINKRFQRNDTPWTLGVSFHNLAGLNDLLGHEKANLVLHHLAHKIIEDSLFIAGITRENMVLSHIGGGEFHLIIQPAIPEEDGDIRVLRTDEIQSICESIIAKTQQLNEMKIADFFKNNGIEHSSLPTMAERFCDIKNPRAELQPSENGITATVSAKAYIVDEGLNTAQSRRGGALASFIGRQLEEAIQTRRAIRKNTPSPDSGPTNIAG